MNRARALIALALLALTAAVYAQVRHHDFVDFDDLGYIVHNRALRADSVPDAIGKAFGTLFGSNWTPLSTLSLQLDRALWDGAPAGTLLTNVALHAFASALLFGVLATMTGALGCSAFVAAVFAVHPLHVESVAWASERRDVLSAVFWMGMLGAWTRYASTRSLVDYAAALLCLVLGLLAKPMVVTAPFVLLLLDYWPLRRLDRRAWLEKVPMFVLVAAVAGVALVLQRGGGATEFGEAIPLWARLANAVDSYAIYLAKSVWPSGLAPFYLHPGEGVPLGRVAAGGALLAALSIGAWALRRSRPYLLTGWLWYLGMLVPVIGVVQVGLQARADRYTYLPMIGLSIAVAWGAAGLARTRAQRAILGAAALATIGALAIVAWIQVGYWSDSVRLFERTVAVEPNSYWAHHRLATAFLREQRLGDAERHYRRVYDLRPQLGRTDLVHFHSGAARVAERNGDRGTALAHLAAILSLDPDDVRANSARGIILVQLGRGEEAIRHLELASAASPSEAGIRAALGTAHALEGRIGDAIAAHRSALALDPGRNDSRLQLAWLLATASDPALRSPDEAVSLAEPLVGGSPQARAETLDVLAAAYASAGRFEDAVRAARGAVERAGARGDAALTEGAAARLELYRARVPYVAPANEHSR